MANTALAILGVLASFGVMIGAAHIFCLSLIWLLEKLGFDGDYWDIVSVTILGFIAASAGYLNWLISSQSKKSRKLFISAIAGSAGALVAILAARYGTEVVGQWNEAAGQWNKISTVYGSEISIRPGQSSKILPVVSPAAVLHPARYRCLALLR